MDCSRDLNRLFFMELSPSLMMMIVLKIIKVSRKSRMIESWEEEKSSKEVGNFPKGLEGRSEMPHFGFQANENG